jgi:hypothetical protein
MAKHLGILSKGDYTMKRTGIALLTAAALLGSASTYAAGASDISWTYLEAAWVNADGDDFNSTDGIAVDGSLGFLGNFYAQGSYSWLTADSTDAGVDADIDTWTITLGYHTDLNTNSQVFFDIGYFDSDFDASGIDSDAGDTDGINLAAGVRYRATETVEFGGALVYADGSVDGGNAGSDFDFNDTSVRIYGQYFIIPAWSVGLRASLSGSGGGATSSSGDSLSLITRYNFGNIL